MNRQRYKLVFNRHRGQLMAVSEISSSVQHRGRTMAPGGGLADWLPSVLRFSQLAITLALALNTVAHAQILGDRNAPRNQQPTVLVTPNGVPVVNIQTPSSAGVSMNQYRQFDVGANGVILNNARVTTATQLGGQVAGNPWLATGAARVIVNQVNSTNPSYLRGYVEVAGARAQVVVANPAGISCAGCGFINANRATLTTGVPQVSNGTLESYRVAGGTVSIDGNGMDASRTDYAEIIARAVQVNAGMWAPELKVSAGLNTVSADHASVVPGVAPTDAAPTVAIDVAQLGGMYAGHIYLTATEHGVGVRNAGTIGASVGQAVVTADGRLENSGTISATGPLAVQASGGVRNSGELGSQSAATITTSTLDNAGSITSAGTLTVQASDAVLNTGSIGGEGGVQIAAASIDNRNSIGSSAGLALQASGRIGNSGTLQATGNVAINAATVDNSGTVRASQGAVQVTSSAASTNSARIEAGQSIALKVGSLDNTASGSLNAVDGLRIEARQAIRNSGNLGANGAIDLQAATLDNGGTVNSSRDAVSVSTSGQLSNRGQINANQALTLTAAGIDNRTGTLNANDVRIDSQGQRVDNDQGQIIARRDLAITSGKLDNNGGSIAAQGKLTIRSADLGNDGGLLQAGDALNIDAGSNTLRNTNSGSDRGIVAQGPLTITAGAVVNRGNVSSGGDLRLRTASLDNDSGVIGANGQLTVEGDSLLNRGGTLQARQGVELQLGSGSLDNSGGLIRTDGTVAVQAGSVRNDNTQTQNQGMEGATVSVGAADISNRQGAVRGDSIAMTASNRIDNGSGLISATDSVSLGDANPAARTLVIDNSNGTVIAGRQTSLLAYSFTGSGKVLSQKDLRIDLVASILHTGQIGATGNATITTTGTFTNAGAVGAGGTLMLTAATIDNQAAGSLVGNTLKLKATDVHTFINRGLIDGVNTVIESSTVNNLGTGRIYGDNIAIGADVLNNQAETLNGVTSAPVIAARNRLDIGAGVINNSEHALIYSVGDMAIGGALDANKRATGSAREVNNSSATINADGNLTIAAGSINNTNAHLETSDQTGPGNRIVSYRVNGSSTLIDGNAASLVNLGSGQVVGPNNWRDMGDEDNFRLVLPSTAYPVERYGPPFTYSRGGKSGGSAVAMAYIEGWQEGSAGGDSSIVEHPAVINYGPTDRIWQVMGVTPPAEDPGIPPGMPRPTETCYESCVTTLPTAEEMAKYKADYAVWKPKYDVFMAALLALNDKITAFNNNVNSRSYKEWTIYDGTEQITRTVVTRSDPGMITSGGNMQLAAGSINNYASQVIAGGTVAGDSINGTAINNTGPLGRQRVVSTGSASYTYVKSHTFSADDRRYDDAPYQSQDIVTSFPLDITPTSGAGPNRASSVRAVASSVSGAAGASAGGVSVRIANLDLTLPNNALYRINAGPAQRYLVQTDPQFVGSRSWASSDFMLNQLGAPTGTRQLGDGFYEQQLIQRQVQQLTGQRYLSGYSSNEAQYQALMNAGLQQAQANRYTLGVALTDAQIAELKTDIVWLVKQTVTLADGSTQEVLVPQVYLHAANVQVTGQGTLIAGNDVAFQAAQDIVNSGGTIAGRQSVSLAGNNVQNLGGRISGSTVTVAAAQDVNNLGGAIDGSSSVTLAAGRDINVNSTTVSTANAVTSGTNINQVASVSGKDITMAAGRDLTANAAVVAGTGDVSLAAGRDVSLGTVNENFRQQISWANDSGASNWVGTLTGPNLVDQSNGAHGISESGVNRATLTGSKDVSTQVSGNNISIRAGQDVVTKGTQIVAEGQLSAAAGRDVRIETANESASARDEHQHSSGGLLTATSVKTDDSSSYSRQVGSTFSGNTVVVRAGNDVNVTGSDVVSTQGTAVVAGNNVNIVAATDSSTQRNFRQETKSGVMGSGFGVTVGSRIQSQDVDGQSQTAAASTVGSVEGNVSIVAGNRYTQVGSDVMAPKGDVDIAAKAVEIKAAEQASKTTTEDKYKQSGVTLSVTSPVISAMQSVDQMADAASKTKSGRAKALAAATAGMSVYSAVGDVQKAAADGSANIGISVMLGSSQNGSRSEQNTLTQRGSTVASGGNMSIRATGDGANSNITIAGSDINAKGNLALKADNDINLIAAQNTDEQHSDRSSSSWGVGFTAQFGTKTQFGFTANAAGSRGNSDGKDVSNAMTLVRAGGQVNIDSGRDTNLVGATVSGEQVVANVGRDLNIASVQDTSTFKSRDESIGGSATIGYGSGASISASRSRVDADYASVGQQAGITAGDGGFQINVKGNTDLKGAQIASTDQAVEQGKNSLTTGTLTSSDIQNRSQYAAESQSVSAGTSQGKPGGGLGIGNASGSETSVTRSGVSGGAVTITDAQAQQAKTGQSQDQVVASLDTSVRTGKDSSNSLAKNWDGNQLREDVEAQAKITQAFGQQAAKLIGDYAGTKEKELRQAAEKASRDGDQALADSLSADADKWKEGGEYRVGAHAAIGLLGGGVGGALGATASSALMPDIAAQIKKLGLPPAVESVVSLAAAAGIGAAVGGSTGAAGAFNVDLNNRQLHQSERDFASLNAKKFSQYYLDRTGQVISEERAEQMLLGDGYRMVDASANKGPGVAGPAGDAAAVSFIAQNANGLFNATPVEYNSPFLNGNKDGSLTQEQAALPGSRGNPALGLATAGLVTGGAALAGVGTATTIAGVMDAWTAYRAASAAYSTGAALGTGVAVGGASYTGAALASSIYDRFYGTGQSISIGFDQRFSFPGLGTAMTVGGLTGMYSTAMFGWAGIPNSFTNWASVPGVIIRINSGVAGKAAGSAAQAAVNSSPSR